MQSSLTSSGREFQTVSEESREGVVKTGWGWLSIGTGDGRL